MRALAFALMLLATPPAVAQEAEIQGVIRDQLTAFQGDDFATAFTFASPMIKGVFGDPQNFGRMVAQGYPMVHRPGAVKMLDLVTRGGVLHQRVLITDAAGRGHVLDYEMIPSADGWQINGVSLERAPDVGA